MDTEIYFLTKVGIQLELLWGELAEEIRGMLRGSLIRNQIRQLRRNCCSSNLKKKKKQEERKKRKKRGNLSGRGGICITFLYRNYRTIFIFTSGRVAFVFSPPSPRWKNISVIKMVVPRCGTFQPWRHWKHDPFIRRFLASLYFNRGEISR